MTVEEERAQVTAKLTELVNEMAGVLENCTLPDAVAEDVIEQLGAQVREMLSLVRIDPPKTVVTPFRPKPG